MICIPNYARKSFFYIKTTRLIKIISSVHQESSCWVSAQIFYPEEDIKIVNHMKLTTIFLSLWRPATSCKIIQIALFLHKFKVSLFLQDPFFLLTEPHNFDRFVFWNIRSKVCILSFLCGWDKNKYKHNFHTQKNFFIQLWSSRFNAVHTLLHSENH